MYKRKLFDTPEKNVSSPSKFFLLLYIYTLIIPTKSIMSKFRKEL